MKTTINQRVKEIADKLCDGNVSELARISGVNQPALRDIVGVKQRKPGFEILNRLAESDELQINTDWLIRGIGPMQRHEINIVHNPPYRDVGSNTIPVYDINAAANLQTLFANDSQHVLGEIKIPNAPDCDGTIYVRGDSMYPLVKSGDMVSYKQLYSIDSLISGEMYIVDFHSEGNDFLVIKYAKWEERYATIRLISYNQHHQDIVIPASAVRAIALVKIVIRLNSMY